MARIPRPGKGRTLALIMVRRKDMFLASDSTPGEIVPKWSLICGEFGHTYKNVSKSRASDDGGAILAGFQRFRSWNLPTAARMNERGKNRSRKGTSLMSNPGSTARLLAIRPS